jgi:hypothetical protein
MVIFTRTFQRLRGRYDVEQSICEKSELHIHFNRFKKWHTGTQLLCYRRVNPILRHIAGYFIACEYRYNEKGERMWHISALDTLILSQNCSRISKPNFENLHRSS